MNLILDIDGTLISESFFIEARPFLKEFLTYCFETFDTVSIWTAAPQEHFEFVNKRFFKPILDSIQQDWKFVFTNKKCSITYIQNDYNYFYKQPCIVKRLKKVWKRPGFTRHNTIIIDDKKYTYMNNWGNAIPIDTYRGEFDDDKLQRLIKFLDIVKEYYLRNGTIRHLEKRFWN